MSVCKVEFLHIVLVLDEMGDAVDLTERAFDFHMPGMADHDERAPLRAQRRADFRVDLGHQRTCRVDRLQRKLLWPPPRLFARRHAR